MYGKSLCLDHVIDMRGHAIDRSLDGELFTISSHVDWAVQPQRTFGFDERISGRR